jgi:hypothetical protein
LMGFSAQDVIFSESVQIPFTKLKLKFCFQQK